MSDTNSKAKPTPAAMPLHFDGDTSNLINAEGVALARFRHFSQGEAVARLCNEHADLSALLARLIDTPRNSAEWATLYSDARALLPQVPTNVGDGK